MATEALKQFARTDGLLKGTAILANLISTACISILPGFGATGLFLANTIQMTIGGLLEVPTGHIADKYGWNRSVKFALWLKVLVTVCFTLSIVSAKAERPQYVWFFLTLEAIVDAFAAAFLSGAYQAAYLNWYRVKTGDSAAPPLFLSSFRYALKIRFVLPLLITSLILALQVLSRNFGFIGSYTVAFSSLAFVSVLRFVVLLKVHSDLKDAPREKTSQAPSTGRKFWQSFTQWKECLLSAYFPAYVTSVSVYLFSILFLVAQVFRLFNKTGIAASMVWTAGILFGVTIYFIRTTLGVLLFPKIGKFAGPRAATLAVISLGSFLLLGGMVVTLNWGFTVEFISLLSLAIISALWTDGIQKMVDSSLDAVVPPEFRATWLSLANAFGMLIFGFLSLVILLLELHPVATGFFCVSFFVMALASAIRLDRFQAKESIFPSFSSAMGTVFIRSSIAIAAVFAIADIIGFSFTAMKIQKEKERTVSRLVLDTVREPLVQGSFIEANRRLTRLKSEGAFVCAKLSVWDFSANLCDPRSATNILHNQVDERLVLSESSNTEFGTVSVVFDRATVLNAIASRILFCLLLLIAGGVALALMFKRLGARIQSELEQVVRLVDGVETEAKRITVREFELIADQLRTAIRLKSEVSAQQAITEVATQVSHDIRSPLTALNMLTVIPGAISHEHEPMVRGAIDRIREITDTLLSTHREKLEELKGEKREPEAVEFDEIASLVRNVVSEKHLQSENKVSIEFSPKAFDGFGVVRIQPAQLKRAVSNLLSNAVEAASTREGQGKVVVDLKLETDQGIQISISDNGPGVPAHLIPQWGTRGASSGKPNGNGLGVWYAKKVVESWGGSIGLETGEGKGTTVSVNLLPPRVSNL